MTAYGLRVAIGTQGRWGLLVGLEKLQGYGGTTLVGAQERRVIANALKYKLGGNKNFGFSGTIFIGVIPYGLYSFIARWGVILGGKTSWVGVTMFGPGLFVYGTFVRGFGKYNFTLSWGFGNNCFGFGVAHQCVAIG